MSYRRKQIDKRKSANKKKRPMRLNRQRDYDENLEYCEEHGIRLKK